MKRRVLCLSCEKIRQKGCIAVSCGVWSENQTFLPIKLFDPSAEDNILEDVSPFFPSEIHQKRPQNCFYFFLHFLPLSSAVYLETITCSLVFSAQGFTMAQVYGLSFSVPSFALCIASLGFIRKRSSGIGFETLYSNFFPGLLTITICTIPYPL